MKPVQLLAHRRRVQLPGRRPISPGGRSGFTLIELVFVIFLLGLLFSFAVPKLNNVTPKYRMRTYARTIGNNIQQMRVIAIARGKNTGLRYVLDSEKQFFQPVPPASPDYPDEPLDERKSLIREETPPGVFIRGIRLPGGNLVTDGVVHVGFSPNGTTGSHIVILEIQPDPNLEPEILSMKFNSISGVLDYYNHEVAFQHFAQ